MKTRRFAHEAMPGGIAGDVFAVAGFEGHGGSGSVFFRVESLTQVAADRICSGCRSKRPCSFTAFRNSSRGESLPGMPAGNRLIHFLSSPLRTLDEIRLVAAWDMTRQARRPSFFLMRLTLAAFIAFQIVMIWWGQVEERRWWSGGDSDALVPISQIVFAIERIFTGSIIIMSVGLLLFCPALTSGTIAGDRERKIWHDLANSPLSGWSILMGKMVARLATLFAWILVALPLWAILSLIGGLDPRAIMLVMLAMFFYGWIYAALGLLASVATKRSRDALGLVMSAVCLLVFVPLTFPEILRGIGLQSSRFRNLLDFAMILDPVYTLPDLPRWINQPLTSRQASRISLPRFFLIISLIGPALTLLAGLLLRPLGRRLDSEGHAGHRPARAAGVGGKRGGLWTFFPNSSNLWLFRLLAEPMMAKERRVRPGSRLTRNLRRFALGLYLCISIGILGASLGRAIQEVLTYGYYSQRTPGRSAVSGICIGITFCSALILHFGVMLDAAGRLVMEKEQDTWTTLLSTPVTPPEILAGKAFGALWSWRWVFVHLGLTWFATVAVGALSPLGLMLSLMVWPIQLGLMTALGLRVGMNSETHATVVSKCIAIFLTVQIFLPVMASWLTFDESAVVAQPAMVAAGVLTAGQDESMAYFGRTLGVGLMWHFIMALAAVFVILRVIGTFERRTGRE